MDDSILEYSTAYKSVYKEKFNDNADKYFDELVKKSGINAEENRVTAKEYRKVQAEADDLAKQIQSKKTLRSFLIVLCVICAIVAIVCFYVAATSQILCIIGGIAGLGVIIALVIVILKVINPQIKNVQKVYDEKAAKAKALKDECYAQLQPLFNLFNNYCTFQLIEQTVPIYKFDRNFNMKRYDYFHGKYGYEYEESKNKSTVDIFSGEVQGNPFFVQKEFDMNMGSETYHGTLVIHWTETVRGSDGKMHTVTRTQTLHASVTKPKPFYSYSTRLVYANDAAPDLNFSRKPQHSERCTPKEIESRVKSGHKKIQKMAEKSLKQGGGFTEMGNPEFDVLFDALDRDNEMQFRLLFTPLAQKNLLNLMKDPEPYGDDFYFTKRKRINYISSEHSQGWDYSVNIGYFISYDVDLCKKQFLDYNNGFFRSLYFDFAPLMSIPLYQQYKPIEYIYQHEYSSNNSMFEAEVLANRLDKTLLQHPNTKTDVILNASLSSKNKDSDTITVSAYSHDAIDRVDYVSVLGGDGRVHAVPVNWVEYIPLENHTQMDLSSVPQESDDLRDDSSGNSAKRHGLIARLI